MAELSLKLPKPRYGQIVVLQKNGDEPRGETICCRVNKSTKSIYNFGWI